MFTEKELEGLSASLKQYQGLESKIKDFLGPEAYMDVMEKMDKYKEMKSDERHTEAEAYLAKIKKDYGGKY